MFYIGIGISVAGFTIMIYSLLSFIACGQQRRCKDCKCYKDCGYLEYYEYYEQELGMQGADICKLYTRKWWKIWRAK